MVFIDTLFPLPGIPQINMDGFGNSGGPIKLLKYTGAFVYKFLPKKAPSWCDRFGFDIGNNVEIPPATIFLS